jgi:hypothetical protein
MKQSRTYKRWIRRMAIGLAVAAVVVPGTQAAGQFPSMEELEQFSFVPEPGATLPTLEQLEQFRFVPSSEPAGPTLVHPFSFQPSNEPVGPTAVPVDPTEGLPTLSDLEKFRFQPNTPQVPVTEPTAAPGIDWADAGIGAGIAIAAVMLAIAAALGLRRHRRLGHA